MKITIIKQYHRFGVKCNYNQKVNQLIKTFKNSYFCASNKTWYLPMTNFTSFINQLNDKEFDIDITDYPPIVYIEPKDDKIYVYFSTFVHDFAKFMQLSGLIYNQDERKIILDKEHMKKIIDLSNELKYQIEIKN